MHYDVVSLQLSFTLAVAERLQNYIHRLYLASVVASLLLITLLRRPYLSNSVPNNRYYGMIVDIL